MNRYEIGLARHVIDDLFWKDFCDQYIEIVKERLYQPDIHGKEGTQSAQFALYYSLYNILKLYAPFVPHITEYIYQQFFRQYEKADSLHQTVWEKPKPYDPTLILFGEKLKFAVSEMRKWKTENGLSLGAPMGCMTITAPKEFMGWFQQSKLDLKACARADEIRFQIEEF